MKEIIGFLKRPKTVDGIKLRRIFFAKISLCVNILYALYNGALGIMSHSIWFISVCVYYVILSGMRFSAILSKQKINLLKEYKAMRVSGILFVILSFVLAGIIYISLSQNIASKFGTIPMITIATYTFYKITMAVIRFIKTKNHPSPLVRVVNSIGYGEIAVSVFTMQKSMLVSFRGMSFGNAYIMNTLTGAGVFLFILFLGIAMINGSIRKGNKKYGKNKNC